MSKHTLLKDIKNQGQDFEWYPTTREIIAFLYADMNSTFKERLGVGRLRLSMLDIGAGDGNIFSVIKELSKSKDKEMQVRIFKAYAIEKSQLLINAMDEDIFVVGTDLWQQSLIDKKVDVTFSNPPYSEYAQWSEKIIKESNSRVIYLVIPERWVDDKRIELALNSREAKAEIIGSFSFKESEYRKARAKVNLVKISLAYSLRGYSVNKTPNVDPFSLWFDEMYPLKEEEEEEKKIDEKDKLNQLVQGDNLIEVLEDLYGKELMHLHENYTSVAGLDAKLLKELGVSKESIVEALNSKIKGLKTLYWEELFNNLDTITSRLTYKSRNSILLTLNQNTSIDFTSSNAYAVVIWAIKNANKYYDKQLLELYEDLSMRDNIINYKSNQRILSDDWRFLKDGFSHYSLDYRIVLTFYGLIGGDSVRNINGLGNVAATFINDSITIAKNLGFAIESSVSDASMKWVSQHKNYFYFKTNHGKVPLEVGTKTVIGKIEDVFYIKEDEEYQYLIDGSWTHWSSVKTNDDIFVEIKTFKNGNLHAKFNQKFMKKLNIEAARLNKWIKRPSEACEEFDITEEEANEYFGSNFSISAGSMKNLLPAHIS